MKGYMVPRKAGWDTHGLPVELEVEKLLGLDGKEQIEQYGVEPFIEKCKESVWKYKGMWEDFSSTVGFWADMDNPYVTYHDDYIESEWWALKQIWDKGLLYKGCKREICHRPLQSKRRGRILPCMDNDSVDSSEQRGTLRKPERDLRKSKGRRRLYLLHGGSSS